MVHLGDDDHSESDRALLVLDVTLGRFRGPSAETFRTALRFIQGEVRYFRERGRMVVFAQPHASQPIADLTPRNDEPSVGLHRISAFADTELHTMLRQRHIARLSIVGFETHLSVLLSAADAAQRGFDVIVPEPCVAAEDHDAHRVGLDLLYRHWPQAQLIRRNKPGSAA
jgi:Isochorismatase family